MANDTSLLGLDNLELASAYPLDSRLSGRPGKLWNSLWPKALAIVAVLALWQLLYVSGYKKSYIFPGPATVLPDLWDQAHHSLLWQAIGTTLQRAVIGYALALVIGSVVGLLVARIPVLRAAVGSIITGLQTMPSIAWFPFAIIFFGINTSAILFVIVLGAAPSIANGLIAGVDYTPPLLLRAGKTMGLRGIALYRYLIVPASLPTYVAGLKQGWAFAWRSLMAGELLVIVANTSSIGVLLSNDQSNLDMAGAMSIMIVILILGIIVDSLFGGMDRRIRRRRGLGETLTGA
jgi:sulfonate transport system permease protein